MVGLPGSSLANDRAAMLATFGLPLAEGLALEAGSHGLGRSGGDVEDAEMLERLADFAAHRRPEPPRPPAATRSQLGEAGSRPGRADSRPGEAGQ